MAPPEDQIVDIPKERLKFFGGPGKMLLPGPATVAALIKRIPKHKLVTTNQLCQELTDQFKVRGTCPVTTQQALQAVANDATRKVPYWRVIKGTGGLFSRFPGGVEAQAALLKKEGFAVVRKGKVPKIKDFQQSLVRFQVGSD
jgi:alkylated DNA nucleotide flippase Atl1